MSGTAYLGLGGNLGDRRGQISAALAALREEPGLRLLAQSGVYETAPVGKTDQPPFYNMVVCVETVLSPRALLARCLAVEARLGRVRAERWGPRTIDIDLLSVDEVVLDEPGLTLPHPRLHERAFVVVPLAEIAPDFRVAGMTASTLARGMDCSGIRPLGPIDTLQA